MSPAREDEIELFRQPQFMPGMKVRAARQVRNDGTMAGREIGQILVRKNELGYVRDIGTFLQRYYVYAVEFIESGAVVGMRGRELVAVEAETGRGARG